MNKSILNSLYIIVGNVINKILLLVFLYFLALYTKDIGLKYYTYAYIPFSIFLELASFGLIPGIAKFIASSKNEYRYHILRIGTLYSLILGFIFMALLNLFKDNILKLSINDSLSILEQRQVLYFIKIASVSIFINPLIHFYKGYLQGKGIMIYSSISLILEGMLRLILFFLIYNKINTYNDYIYIFIINIIVIYLSIIPLLIGVFKDYFKDYKITSSIKGIITNSIPVGIVTLFFTFYQLIDSLTLESLGVKSEIYTAYLFESIRLIFIPITLAQAIGSYLNPKITYLRNNNKIIESNNLTIKITNLAIRILIPLSLIIIFYSKRLYQEFYHKSITENVLANTSYLIFFIGFYKVLIGVCCSLDKFEYIIYTTFISIISKIVLNKILVTTLGYRGSIISTCIGIGICIIVCYYILRKNKIKIFISNLKSLFSSILLSIFALIFMIFFNLLFPLIKLGFLKEMILSSFIMLLIYFLLYYLLTLTKIKKNHNI